MFQAAAISVGATISSVALAPAATSAGTTPAAASMSAKCISDSAVRGCSGSVSNTASARNASVPSEPISRRLKISSGSSASRKAHRR